MYSELFQFFSAISSASSLDSASTTTVFSSVSVIVTEYSFCDSSAVWHSLKVIFTSSLFQKSSVTLQKTHFFSLLPCLFFGFGFCPLAFLFCVFACFFSFSLCRCFNFNLLSPRCLQ